MKSRGKKIGKPLKSPVSRTINEIYQESFETIKQAKKCIYFGIAIFMIFALIGYLFPVFFVDEVLEILKQLIASFEGLTTGETIIMIFFNNTLITFLTIILGLLIGLFPLWALIQNGYVLGFVINKVSTMSSLTEIWRLLPHGIFELPAVFISIGLGLKIGEKVLLQDGPLKFIKKALRTFIWVVVPLLVVAAIIEGLLIGLGI